MTALAGIIPLKARGMKSAVEVIRIVPGVRDEQIESSAMEAECGGSQIRVLYPIWLTASKLDLAMTVSQDDQARRSSFAIFDPVCPRLLKRGLGIGGLWGVAVRRVVGRHESDV